MDHFKKGYELQIEILWKVPTANLVMIRWRQKFTHITATQLSSVVCVCVCKFEPDLVNKALSWSIINVQFGRFGFLSS